MSDRLLPMDQPPTSYPRVEASAESEEYVGTKFDILTQIARLVLKNTTKERASLMNGAVSVLDLEPQKSEVDSSHWHFDPSGRKVIDAFVEPDRTRFIMPPQHRGESSNR